MVSPCATTVLTSVVAGCESTTEVCVAATDCAGTPADADSSEAATTIVAVDRVAEKLELARLRGLRTSSTPRPASR